MKGFYFPLLVGDLLFEFVFTVFLKTFNFILKYRHGTVLNNLPASAKYARDKGSIPGLKDPLEEEIATHSSIIAWIIPWTEEPGRLQSMGSQRVGQ